MSTERATLEGDSSSLKTSVRPEVRLRADPLLKIQRGIGVRSMKFRIAETRSLSFRLDARNLFNHPTPVNPNLNVNSGTFGQITTQNGSRSLATQIRLEF